MMTEPKKRPIRYRVTLETLSPMHIGVGRVLRRDIDYAVKNGRTWVIDQDALAERVYDTSMGSEWNAMLSGRPASELVNKADYHDDSPLFRYILGGEPESKTAGAEMQELMKDVWDQPYIPGSSLKGALRTAMLYVFYGELKLKYSVDEMGGRSKFAAQSLERSIVSPIASRGKEPNHDLFRAIHVADSAPDRERRLRVINGAVFAKGEVGTPIVLEGIPAGVTFSTSITLDTALLEDSEKNFGWKADKHQKWLRLIRPCVNIFSHGRIDAEIAYWKERSSTMEGFYRQLLRQITAAENTKTECLLQLGWGGGWTSKTFGDRLTGDAANFSRVMGKFGRDMLRQGTHKPGDAYPKSRRVVTQNEQAMRPFGWVKMTMEREA